MVCGKPFINGVCFNLPQERLIYFVVIEKFHFFLTAA